MACHGYLQLEGRTFLIEYIVRNCTYPITGIEDHKPETTTTKSDSKNDGSLAVPTTDVRVMCRNILNAFSSTIEGMDEVRILKIFYIKSNYFI